MDETSSQWLTSLLHFYRFVILGEVQVTSYSTMGGGESKPGIFFGTFLFDNMYIHHAEPNAKFSKGYCQQNLVKTSFTSRFFALWLEKAVLSLIPLHSIKV